MRKVFLDWFLLCGFVLLVLVVFGSFALAQNVGACSCHVGGAACYCQPASICPNCPNPANLRDAPAVQYVSYQVGNTKAPAVKIETLAETGPLTLSGKPTVATLRPVARMPVGPACPTGVCPAAGPAAGPAAQEAPGRFPAVHAALERQPVRSAVRRLFRPFSRLRGRGCG